MNTLVLTLAIGSLLIFMLAIFIADQRSKNSDPLVLSDETRVRFSPDGAKFIREDSDGHPQTFELTETEMLAFNTLINQRYGG